MYGSVSYAMTSGFTVGANSCFQALVAQEPVAADYNGPLPVQTVSPITGVTISDCDLGTPVCMGPASSTVPGPLFVVHTNGITLKNVVVAGTTYNSVLTG
jgi:polygalacturonase